MFCMAFLPRSVTDFSAVLCLVYYRLPAASLEHVGLCSKAMRRDRLGMKLI
jgi:hypothetical protein